MRMPCVTTYFAAVALLAVTDAIAADLTSEQTAAALAGNTWSGTNAEEDQFAFYHAPDGAFRAKITSPAGQEKAYSGRWSTRGSDLCWAWDGWKTFCYYKFERFGSELSMTRSDGIVHSGAIVAGNPGGL